MTLEVQETTEVPLESDEIKQPEQTTPESTADAGDVDKPKQAEQAPKTFTQAEVDAIVQRQKLKVERRIHRDVEQRLRDQVAVTPPTRETFATDEDFTQAAIDHRAEVKARQLIEQREKQTAAEKQREAFIERAETVQERYPDFKQVTENPSLPINGAMADFIEDSEHGPDVAYFLGKNPGKAYEISQLSPVRAARELLRIETELAARPKANPSKAPEPITPVGTRGKASSSSMPSDSDPIDVWMQKERERVAKRR